MSNPISPRYNSISYFESRPGLAKDAISKLETIVEEPTWALNSRESISKPRIRSVDRENRVHEK